MDFQENTTGRFERSIRDTIHKEIAIVAEEETAAAQQRIAERVRERIGSITISLCKYVEVQSMNDQLSVIIRDPDNTRDPFR